MDETVPVGTVELITQIMGASAASNFRTMDTLFEREREARQALEMLIDEVLDRLDRAHMGSAREYETAVMPLREGVWGRMAELAAKHPENGLA